MEIAQVPYQPLDTSKREIRLLFIQPGPWSSDSDWTEDDMPGNESRLDEDQMDNDTVRCTLRTVSLDDNPEYEALSYVWGASRKRTGIVVDGVWAMVTVNLQRALRRLRLVHEQRIMWVDALCINQEDIAERGHQVGMMAALYSSCSRCVIWLGEEEDFPLRPYDLNQSDDGYNKEYRGTDISAFEEYLTNQQEKPKLRPIKRNVQLDPGAASWLDVDAAFDLAIMLAENANRHLFELPFYQITEFPRFKVCRNWQNAWYSLHNIIAERPWWGRTWTVQEVVLPRAAVVQLGNHRIWIQALLSSAAVFSAHAMGCCDKAFGDIWKPLIEHEVTISAAFTRVEEINTIIGMMRDKEHTNLSDVYLSSRNREASDPRDSIFGMLGMFPDLLGAGHGPEYTKSAAMVYSEATRRMIEDDGNLDCLQWTSLSKVRENLHLPSWAPDWGYSERLFTSRGLEACGNFLQYESSGSPSTLILPIYSHRIGTISKRGTKSEEHAFVRSTLLDWGQLSTDMDTEFWRTVFQDRRIAILGGNNLVYKDDFDLVQQWWKWICTPNSQQSSVTWSNLYDRGPTDDLRSVSNLLAVMYTELSGHVGRYFISNLGGQGLARAFIEVGDQIHIARGCKAPMILRSMNGIFDDVTDEIRPDTYQFVACCYLDEFMDGEGVEGEVDWKKVYLR